MGFSQDYSEYDGPADEWGTPAKVWRPLSKAVGGFDLDPCAGAAPTPIAAEQYEYAGLEKRWNGCVWVNPPYSDPGPWLEKGVKEVSNGNAKLVLYLLPARTHTNWFQDQLPQIEFVLFYRGKIKFLKAGEKSPNAAPFSTMLVAVGQVPGQLVETCNTKGWVVRPDIERPELGYWTTAD